MDSSKAEPFPSPRGLPTTAHLPIPSGAPPHIGLPGMAGQAGLPASAALQAQLEAKGLWDAIGRGLFGGGLGMPLLWGGLRHKTKEDIALLNEYFKLIAQQDLEPYLQNVIGDHHPLQRALLSELLKGRDAGGAQADALYFQERLLAAFKNPKAFFQLLAHLNPQERQRVAQAYAAQYGKGQTTEEAAHFVLHTLEKAGLSASELGRARVLLVSKSLPSNAPTLTSGTGANSKSEAHAASTSPTRANPQSTAAVMHAGQEDGQNTHLDVKTASALLKAPPLSEEQVFAQKLASTSNPLLDEEDASASMGRGPGTFHSLAEDDHIATLSFLAQQKSELLLPRQADTLLNKPIPMQEDAGSNPFASLAKGEDPHTADTKAALQNTVNPWVKPLGDPLPSAWKPGVEQEQRPREDSHGQEQVQWTPDKGLPEHWNFLDWIANEDIWITITYAGFIQVQTSAANPMHPKPADKPDAWMAPTDWIDHSFRAAKQDTLLCFTDRGRAYGLKVWEIPQGLRSKSIVTLLPLENGESIRSIVPAGQFLKDHYIVIATHLGQVSQMPLETFSTTRKPGVTAMDLAQDDHLIGAALTDGTRDVLLFSNRGQMIRFDENKARAIERRTRGVPAMPLKSDEHLVALVLSSPERSDILVATTSGVGARFSAQGCERSALGSPGTYLLAQGVGHGGLVSAMSINESDTVRLVPDAGAPVYLEATRIPSMRDDKTPIQWTPLVETSHLAFAQRVVPVAQP